MTTPKLSLARDRAARRGGRAPGARGRRASFLACMTRVGRDLVVATPARMQATTCRANRLGQVALDGHVDILVARCRSRSCRLRSMRAAMASRPDAECPRRPLLGDDALTWRASSACALDPAMSDSHMRWSTGSEAPKAWVNSAVGESSKRPPHKASFSCACSAIVRSTFRCGG